MVNEDQVRTLFARANPVPDSGLINTAEFGRPAQLDAIERSSEMTKTETPSRHTEAVRTPLTPWLVAALVIVLVGTVVLLTREGPVNTPVATAPPAPAPTTPPEITEPEVVVEPGVVNVEAFIAAFNVGDVEGMIEVVAPGYPLVVMINEDYAHHEQLLFAMGTRWELVEPCKVSADSVDCAISVTDNLFGPAGFDHTSTFVFDVDDRGRILRWDDRGCCERQTEYIQAFWRWLEAAYPEDYAEFDALADFTLPHSLPGYRLGRPSLMTKAIGYVDEFLAQSDVYPLDPA